MTDMVLLGCPGAGKGTLAKQLETRFQKFIITPGELYRKEAELGTEFGLKAKEYWGDGNLCPDEMTNELIRKTVNSWIPNDRVPMNCGFVFDGYPRTVEQAKYLDSILNIHLVLDISISDDVAVQRLLRRATIENRPDDTEEIIRQRLAVYHKNNGAIVDYYQGERYCALNGEGTPEETLDLAAQIILEHAEKVIGEYQNEVS